MSSDKIYGETEETVQHRSQGKWSSENTEQVLPTEWTHGKLIWGGCPPIISPPPQNNITVTPVKLFEDISNIGQLDGQDSIVSDATDQNDESSVDTEYATDDEACSEPIPANLHPLTSQMTNQGEPITLEVGSTNLSLPSLPLFFVLNVRSVFNKADSLDEILKQILCSTEHSGK